MAILEDDEVNEQEVKMEDYIKKIVENIWVVNFGRKYYECRIHKKKWRNLLSGMDGTKAEIIKKYR